MWPSTPSAKLSLILACLRCGFVRGDNSAVPPIESTSTSSTQTSSWSTLSTITTVTSSASSPESTITSFSTLITAAPTGPWGTQIIPNNTCSVPQDDGSFQYTPCNIFAGTVQLSYFPENSGNVTYPSTYYDPKLSITLTSPSVYMVVNTITGDNQCGALGPTYKDAIISMDFTDVSTLQPYADHTVTTRMGPPRQLTLDDIMSGCPGTYATFSTDGAFLNTHPVYGPYNKCHPRFVFPIQLKRLGYPYWTHCSNYDYELGIFDPPGAVPPATGLFPESTTAGPITTTTTPASTIPTVTPSQPANKPPSHVISTASSTTTSSSSVTTSPDEPSSSHSPPPEHEEPTADPLSTPSSSKGPTSSLSSHSTVPANGVTKPPVTRPTSATPIATIGSDTISAIPGSSGVILPNGSTVRPGSEVTFTDSHSQPVVVSVDSSGIHVGGKTGSSTFISNPTITPAATFAPSSSLGDSTFIIDGVLVTVHAGASTIVIGDQTVTMGGPLVTLSNHDVLSLGPSGLVIQMPSGGVSTVTIAAKATDSMTTNTSNGLGGIIVSIGGMGNATASASASASESRSHTTATELTEPPTQATSVSPPQTTLNSGSQAGISNVLFWMACCLLLGYVPWM